MVESTVLLMTETTDMFVSHSGIARILKYHFRSSLLQNSQLLDPPRKARLYSCALIIFSVFITVTYWVSFVYNIIFENIILKKMSPRLTRWQRGSMIHKAKLKKKKKKAGLE